MLDIFWCSLILEKLCAAESEPTRATSAREQLTGNAITKHAIGLMLRSSA